MTLASLERSLRLAEGNDNCSHVAVPLRLGSDRSLIDAAGIRIQRLRIGRHLADFRGVIQE